MPRKETPTMFTIALDGPPATRYTLALRYPEPPTETPDHSRAAHFFTEAGAHSAAAAHGITGYALPCSCTVNSLRRRTPRELRQLDTHGRLL